MRLIRVLALAVPFALPLHLEPGAPCDTVAPVPNGWYCFHAAPYTFRTVADDSTRVYGIGGFEGYFSHELYQDGAWFATQRAARNGEIVCVVTGSHEIRIERSNPARTSVPAVVTPPTPRRRGGFGCAG